METFKTVFSMGRDKIISSIKYVYSDINPSTLTGAIDIIVIEQPDGTFKCGPFHVRFGKMGILKPADKIVDIHLNGQLINHLRMKLGSAGEAYFVEHVDNNQQNSFDMSLAVSPISSDTEDSKDEIDGTQRALSAENIASDLLELNVTRNNAKKRIRRGNRPKNSESSADVRNEEFVGSGYNSDGEVDHLTENFEDRSMSWDWGNFPSDNNTILENKERKEKRSGSEVYLEDLMTSKDGIENYIYCSGKENGKEGLVSPSDGGYKSDGDNSASVNELSLSLCGDAYSGSLTEEKFFEHLVSFEEFMKEPNKIMRNNDLVLLLNGHYYNWAVAGPMLVALVGYKQELPPPILHGLKAAHMPEQRRRSSWWIWRRQEPTPVAPDLKTKNNQKNCDINTVTSKKFDSGNIVTNDEIFNALKTAESDQNISTSKIDNSSLQTSNEEAQIVDITFSNNPNKIIESPEDSDLNINTLKSRDQSIHFTNDANLNMTNSKNSNKNIETINNPDLSVDTLNNPDLSVDTLKSRDQNMCIIDKPYLKNTEDENTNIGTCIKSNPIITTAINVGIKDRLDIPDPKITSHKNSVQIIPTSTDSSICDQSSFIVEKSPTDASTSSDITDTIESNPVYMKKIRLSSEEIVSLNLKPGRNDITFSMITKYQGTTKAHAAIYLWHWQDRIVISDVDGTITKSDVLGHVLPILGRDWTQNNVVKLYNRIHRNNYRFIYLSARAIGQSGRTRTFLYDLKDTSERLPDGPILLSPTSLFQSWHREVIEKKPEYFKIQCLKDVQSLFPNGYGDPLYSGFGNRVNDVIAYKAVGIDSRRIFTVDPVGTLVNEYCQKWPTDYGKLAELVDHFFHFHVPGIDIVANFSEANFWRMLIDDQVVRDEVNKAGIK